MFKLVLWNKYCHKMNTFSCRPLNKCQICCVQQNIAQTFRPSFGRGLTFASSNERENCSAPASATDRFKYPHGEKKRQHLCKSANLYRDKKNPTYKIHHLRDVLLCEKVSYLTWEIFINTLLLNVSTLLLWLLLWKHFYVTGSLIWSQDNFDHFKERNKK